MTRVTNFYRRTFHPALRQSNWNLNIVFTLFDASQLDRNSRCKQKSLETQSLANKKAWEANVNAFPTSHKLKRWFWSEKHKSWKLWSVQCKTQCSNKSTHKSSLKLGLLEDAIPTEMLHSFFSVKRSHLQIRAQGLLILNLSYANRNVYKSVY